LEHEEYKVLDIEGFVLWSSWNKKSSYRGIEDIAYYIKMNTSPHILPHKNDPLNQYIWMKVLDINAKKIYIEVCYFAPINSTFYKKNNLDKNCPYKNLKQYIYNLRNEGSILLLGHFNARIATNQSIF
jgi:hypothetical protein